MGDDGDSQNGKKDAKENEKPSHETLGKFFFDLAKIVFAALVIGSVASIMSDHDKTEYWILIAIGSFVTYVFALIGYKIIKS